MVHPASSTSVVALVRDRVQLFELGIAVEVFGLPRPEFPDWYEFAVASAGTGPVAALGGVVVTVDAGLAEVATAGTVVLPGWPGDRPMTDPERDALRSAVERGGRVLAVCSGAFAAAEAGLLDGCRATTHWRDADRLAARFPRVEVTPDALYVDEGHVVTSAGSAAGLDAALHVVREDHGAAVAAAVARRLVLPPHRDGGQSQYVAPISPEVGGDLAELLAWIEANLRSDLTVDALARRLAVSTRTLDRRFRDHVGTPPGRWVIDRRLDAARALLAGGDLPVERVATEVGFSSAGSLRHHLRNRFGTSPGAYRRRFADG